MLRITRSMADHFLTADERKTLREDWLPMIRAGLSAADKAVGKMLAEAPLIPSGVEKRMKQAGLGPHESLYTKLVELSRG